MIFLPTEQNNVSAVNDIPANRAEQWFVMYIIIVCMQRSKCICNKKTNELDNFVMICQISQK